MSVNDGEQSEEVSALLAGLGMGTTGTGPGGNALRPNKQAPKVVLPAQLEVELLPVAIILSTLQLPVTINHNAQRCRGATRALQAQTTSHWGIDVGLEGMMPETRETVAHMQSERIHTRASVVAVLPEVSLVLFCYCNILTSSQLNLLPTA